MITFGKFLEGRDDDIAATVRLVNKLKYELGMSPDEIMSMDPNEMASALGIGPREVGMIKSVASGATRF